jgi:hypothetical protein
MLVHENYIASGIASVFCFAILALLIAVSIYKYFAKKDHSFWPNDHIDAKTDIWLSH